MQKGCENAFCHVDNQKVQDILVTETPLQIALLAIGCLLRQYIQSRSIGDSECVIVNDGDCTG